MITEKRHFLEKELISILKQIPADTRPLWGKMTLQQMIEHFSDSVRIASGKIAITHLVTPQENLESMRSFLQSDKPFRENTKNPLLPELPPPVKNSSIKRAIEELQTEIIYFFKVFEENKMPTTKNPFFGDLDFSQNVQLLYKHAVHHLKQFGTGPGISLP